jgi:hypothetical protein
MEVNFEKMNILLGVKIIEMRRVFIENNYDCYPLMDTLVVKLQNDTVINLIKSNQNGLIIQPGSSKDQPLIDTEFEIDAEDKLLTKEVETEYLNFPLEVESITEFWAGSKGQEFLVGFVLQDSNQETLMSICTETDEIELMSNDAFRERIQSLPFYYGMVTTHWYKKD